MAPELITRTTRTMRGHHVSTPPRKLPGTFEKGRVCSEPECQTRLSIFNPGPSCHPCWLSSLPAEERTAA